MKQISISLFLGILSVLIAGGSTRLYAGEETTGWYSASGSHRLFIDGIRVYESAKGEKIDLPTQLTQAQEIATYLYLAEYFLRQKNKQGIAAILYKIRLKPKDYRLSDALITTLWKRSSGEEETAQKTLESYVRAESDPYYKSIARNLYISLFASNEDERKTPELLFCDPELPYYSFCRLFRLQYYLDKTQGTGDVLESHYANIFRVLSPFYEEKSLHSIPFLEELDEDLPPRLAFLGLANESLNFQRMILEAEKAAYGSYTENSLERLSFFQILAGNWEDATLSLKDLALGLRSRKKSYRNRILIKLGMAYYLSRKYEEALKSFLEIDFSEWSGLITHPLTNEPLSIPEAKDLISLAVWKTRGKQSAVAALREIPKGDRVYQEEVWPRLRIAQLIMDSNPDLSSRIIDEISYLAQSRGWKKLEYTATLLQGYNQILEGQHRRSTVEFTKARGILGSKEIGFANEWLRNSGMFYAHQASGVKAPVSAFLQSSLAELKKEYPDEEYLSIVYYRAEGFEWNRFVKTAVEYLKETEDSRTLMETILYYFVRNRGREPVYSQGIFQIPQVQDRFQKYSGFQTARDSNFIDSYYSQSREAIAKHLKGKNKILEVNFDRSARNPFLVALPWQENLYLFFFDPHLPGQKRWSHAVVPGTNPFSSYGKEQILNFMNSLTGQGTVQIFFNDEGLRIYESLRQIYKDQAFGLFYRFQVNPDPVRERNLVPVVWRKSPPSASIQTATLASWEGNQPFVPGSRLHIWDYKNLSPRSLIKMEWKNGEDSETMSLRRILRRLDKRTIPTSIFTSSDSLGMGYSFDRARWIEWASLWLESGTETVYYRREIPWNELQSFYKTMPIGVAWNQDSEVIVVSRDLY